MTFVITFTSEYHDIYDIYDSGVKLCKEAEGISPFLFCLGIPFRHFLVIFNANAFVEYYWLPSFFLPVLEGVWCFFSFIIGVHGRSGASV